MICQSYICAVLFSAGLCGIVNPENSGRQATAKVAAARRVLNTLFSSTCAGCSGREGPFGVGAKSTGYIRVDVIDLLSHYPIINLVMSHKPTMTANVKTMPAMI